MSLHTLANHMAAQGRGPDRSLVHMSPREIQGLQSLAQAHGRSLTINPQTGMPEAGILEDILPSIAGFAMDAFAPGSGAIASGIGSLLGGGSSGETTKSSPMGLASTSLERGLQAGFNTSTDIYEPSSKQISEKESPAGAFNAIQSSITPEPPKDYLKDNKYDMYTAPSYSGYGATQHYDSGGMTIGNIGAPVDAKGNPIVIDPYDTRTDSQKAQDYLLGKSGAVNPFLFYHGAIPPEAKAALASSQISALYPETASSMSSRGLSYEQRAERDDPNAWGNLTDQQQSAYFVDHPDMAKATQYMQGLWNGSWLGQLQNKFDPSIQAKYQAIQERANEARQLKNALENAPDQRLSYITQNPYETGRGLVPAPSVDNSFNPISGYSIGPADNSFNPISGYSIGPAPADNSNPISGYSIGPAPDNSGGRRDAGGNDGAGATNSGDNGGWGSRDAGGDARGGYLDHGKFDQRYAVGGIAALAQGGYNLGSYSDGGRLLRGPGDGVSDDIPATIGQNQPARLADGEFVIPARIVSELGNGSTEAGARKLYAMMDRVQKARSKTVGKDRIAANSRADKYLPS